METELVEKTEKIATKTIVESAVATVGPDTKIVKSLHNSG